MHLEGLQVFMIKKIHNNNKYPINMIHEIEFGGKYFHQCLCPFH